MNQPCDKRASRARALIDFAREQAESAHCARSSHFRPLPDEGTFAGYTIVQEISRGGQGIVFRATQCSTGKDVALKLQKDGVLASRREIARFERERDILARLNDPHIVKILDAGSSPLGQFLVMDFIKGDPLHDYVRLHNLPAERVLNLFAKICNAVNSTHVRGVIHRDLKPSNILIDEQGTPFVLDFGAARHDWNTDAESIDVTVTGQFVGSLPWASPEQVTGGSDNADTRSDVYSLGVVLYQLLGGDFPYPVRGSPRETADTIVNAEPTPLRRLNPKFSGEVETIVHKCLHKDPNRRYQNAGNLADDLQRYLAGQPIEAKRDSTWYVMSKSLRRHRGLTLSAILILASWGIGGGTSHYYASKNRESAAAREREANQKLQLLQELNDEKNYSASLQRSLDQARERYPQPAESLNEKTVVIDHASFETKLRDIEARIQDGAFDEAIARAKAFSDFAHESFGANDPFSMQASYWLGVAYTRVRRLDEAAQILEDLLSRERALLQEKDIIELARTLDQLAQIYHLRKADNATSEKYAREAYGIFQRKLGSTHPETLGCVQGLSNYLNGQKKYAEAEAVLRDNLNQSRKVLGDGHPDLMQPIFFLADTLYRQDPKGVETFALAQEAADLAKAKIQQDPMFARLCLELLAQIHWGQGRKVEASEAWELGVRAARLSPNQFQDSGARQTLSNYAESLRQLCQCQQATSTYEECSQVYDEFVGIDSKAALQVLWHWSGTLRECDRWEEQESLLVDFVERLCRGHQDTLYQIRNLNRAAQVWFDHARPDLAEQILRNALESSEKVLESANEASQSDIVKTRGDTLKLLFRIFDMAGRNAERKELEERLGD